MFIKPLAAACTVIACCGFQPQAGAAAPERPPDASPAASPSQANASSEVKRWEVMATDVTLAKTLERWSAAAGHKLKWDAARNFLIGAPDVYVGTFEEALQHVLRSPGIRFSDYPLEACVYANTPPLVRITRLGEQVRECATAAQ